MLFTHSSEIPFRLTDLPQMPLPKRVIMVDPAYFDVLYVINPHMEGHIGGVDTNKAYQQWEAMRQALEQTGLEVHVVPGEAGLPDMVFCANQSLPSRRSDGSLDVIMSIMHADQRKAEVPFIEQFYREQGYHIHHLDSNKIADFEGMGDAIWHPSRRLIWGGYGYRSSLAAYEEVSRILNVDVIALELVDPAFYHLDTCLSFLNEHSALYYPKAFTETGLDMLRAFIPHLIEVSTDDAIDGFACNALCADGKHVLIHHGLTETNRKLREADFTVHELDTSEFLKSGGSVFCMKMMFW
jgi:N-dimethylarginine dimethylaminohydrolase